MIIVCQWSWAMYVPGTKLAYLAFKTICAVESRAHTQISKVHDLLEHVGVQDHKTPS